MSDIGRAANMVDEHAEDWEKDSKWAARLGEHPSWADVVTLYNECYGSDEQYVVNRTYRIAEPSSESEVS